MANPTYLQLVNKVLKRMREPEVTAIANDEYAVLISTFINDAKEQVEDAHDWSAHLTETVVGLIPGQTKYSLTNSANRVKIDTVVNTDAPSTMIAKPRSWITKQIQFGTAGQSRPTFWCNDGVDGNGDAQVSVYPAPADVENVTFTGWTRPGELDNDADTLICPEKPVVLLALAFAVRERGEVGGQTALEYFELAKRSLSDAIAYDAARNEDEDTWYWN